MNMIIVLIFLSVSITFAQSEQNFKLSGSLKNDTQFIHSQNSFLNNSHQLNIEPKKKRPILAGVLSFALPGAGELYTENYLKAGIFFALEAAAITFAVVYNNKGNTQTEFFENYANQHWSAERYAKWTLKNASFINPNVDPSLYNVFDQTGNLNWKELNRLENAIGGYYSHRLAPFGDQQYYEMIGKYSQFNVGWDTFGDENTPYIWGVDPLVDQFHYYSNERKKANDLYTVSKWAVVTVVANHFISALDAAWSASKYNKNIQINVSLEQETIGFYSVFYPQLNIYYNF